MAAGVVLTFYLLLRLLDHPVVVELRRPPSGGDLETAREGDEAIPGLLVLRIEGTLYTVNIHVVQRQILAQVSAQSRPPEVVLVDVGGTVATSVTAMDVFAETDQQLRQDGVTLWVAALPQRAVTVARRTAAWERWATAGRLHRSVSEAIKAFEDHHPAPGS